MRIGIYGGSFNPIHKGHIHVAKAAFTQYKLDLLYLIPSFMSPNKFGQDLIQPKHRINMCEIVANKEESIVVNDIEASSSEISYTYITLQKLKEQHEEDELFFIMGADSLDYLDQWKNPEIIMNLATILVLERTGFGRHDMEDKISYLSKQYDANIKIIDDIKYDASSTEVKKALKKHPNICPPVLDIDVYKYIQKNHLYGL